MTDYVAHVKITTNLWHKELIKRDFFTSFMFLFKNFPQTICWHHKMFSNHWWRLGWNDHLEWNDARSFPKYGDIQIIICNLLLQFVRRAGNDLSKHTPICSLHFSGKMIILTLALTVPKMQNLFQGQKKIRGKPAAPLLLVFQVDCHCSDPDLL